MLCINALNLFILLWLLTFLVNSRYRLDTVIAQRRQNFDKCAFVSTHTGNGIVQFLSIQFGKRCHQCADGILEISGQFRLQLGDEVLAIHRLEFVGDLQSLDDAPMSQNIDDCLFVSPETLHGGSYESGIFLSIEGIGRIYGGRTLGAFIIS